MSPDGMEELDQAMSEAFEGLPDPLIPGDHSTPLTWEFQTVQAMESSIRPPTGTIGNVGITSYVYDGHAWIAQINVAREHMLNPPTLNPTRDRGRRPNMTIYEEAGPIGQVQVMGTGGEINNHVAVDPGAMFYSPTSVPTLQPNLYWETPPGDIAGRGILDQVNEVSRIPNSYTYDGSLTEGDLNVAINEMQGQVASSWKSINKQVKKAKHYVDKNAPQAFLNNLI